MSDLSLEEKEKLAIEKKAEADIKLKKLKKKYVVRSFRTTSEAFKFMKKISKVISAIPDLEEMADKDILELFNVFDEETIKYVISTFVLKRTEKESETFDYEKEFKEDFDTLLMLFMMAIQYLMEKVNGGGKSKKPAQKKINSQKR